MVDYIGVDQISMVYSNGSARFKGVLGNNSDLPLTVGHIAVPWLRSTQPTNYFPKQDPNTKLYYLNLGPRVQSELNFSVPVTAEHYRLVTNRERYLYLQLTLKYKAIGGSQEYEQPFLYEYEPELNRFRGAPFMPP